jgi:hypothetical protein
VPGLREGDGLGEDVGGFARGESWGHEGAGARGVPKGMSGKNTGRKPGSSVMLAS